MKLKYLKDCTNLEELKKEYRNYALRLHPDRGGNEKEMQLLNAEYEYLSLILVSGHENSKKEHNKESAETMSKFKDIINKLLKYHGLQIDVVGTWLWLSGNTYIIKEELKDMEFNWSKGKKMWYYSAEVKSNYNARYKQLDYSTLKSKFGVETIKTELLKSL